MVFRRQSVPRPSVTSPTRRPPLRKWKNSKGATAIDSASSRSPFRHLTSFSARFHPPLLSIPRPLENCLTSCLCLFFLQVFRLLRILHQRVPLPFPFPLLSWRSATQIRSLLFLHIQKLRLFCRIGTKPSSSFPLPGKNHWNDGGLCN